MTALWRYRVGLAACIGAFAVWMTQAPKLPWWAILGLFVVAAVSLRFSLVAVGELEAASTSKPRPTSPPA